MVQEACLTTLRINKVLALFTLADKKDALIKQANLSEQ